MFNQAQERDHNEPFPTQFYRQASQQGAEIPAVSEDVENDAMSIDTVADSETSYSKPKSTHRHKTDYNQAPPAPREEQCVTALLHALWQRQDRDIVVQNFHRTDFQHLCFDHGCTWKGSKRELYERLQPIVRLLLS